MSEKIKGFIRSGSTASDSEIVLLNLQVIRDNDYKKYVTAFYIEGENRYIKDDGKGKLVRKSFDDFDIAEAGKIKEFQCRGHKVGYWITKLIKLPDTPRANKKMRWTERRHKRMKEILGWNFLDRE